MSSRARSASAATAATAISRPSTARTRTESSLRELRREDHRRLVEALAPPPASSWNTITTASSLRAPAPAVAAIARLSVAIALPSLASPVAQQPPSNIMVANRDLPSTMSSESPRPESLTDIVDRLVARRKRFLTFTLWILISLIVTIFLASTVLIIAHIAEYSNVSPVPNITLLWAGLTGLIPTLSLAPVAFLVWRKRRPRLLRRYHARMFHREHEARATGVYGLQPQPQENIELQPARNRQNVERNDQDSIHSAENGDSPATIHLFLDFDGFRAQNDNRASMTPYEPVQTRPICTPSISPSHEDTIRPQFSCPGAQNIQDGSEDLENLRSLTPPRIDTEFWLALGQPPAVPEVPEALVGRDSIEVARSRANSNAASRLSNQEGEARAESAASVESTGTVVVHRDEGEKFTEGTWGMMY